MFSIDEKALALWYKQNKRELPWRKDDHPYHVLVSEIMLQQTRIETVIPYYERFVRELPDFEHLAACEDEKMYKLWEGLGYYSRVRNLRETARKIVSLYGGLCPEDYKALLGLPGIGEYTAGALMSIAFHKPYPVCDGNVLRVYSRLICSDRNVLDPKVKKECTEAYGGFLASVKEDAGLLNQGIMELGETICLPNTEPLCSLCPLKESCRGYLTGRARELPVRIKSVSRTVEEKTLMILEKEGKTGLVRNTEEGLLSGMYAIPSVNGFQDEAGLVPVIQEMGLEILSIERLEDKKHLFSHREWRMHAYYIRVAGNETEQVVFADKEELKSRYALPSAYRKWKIVR